MDRRVFLSMSGARAAMQRQDVLAHNLANVATPGFRAELQALRAAPQRDDGAPTRVFAAETTVGHRDTPGPQMATGRALDVALAGRAWLTVQASDGGEAHTRAGALDLAPDGMLVTRGSGLPVLGEGGPILVPPGAEPGIGPDGRVTARMPGAPAVEVGRLRLVTPPAPLQRGDDGLFRPDPAVGRLPPDPSARLQDGALEGSNVGAVESMVAMIAAGRLFDAQMRAIQTADRDAQVAQKLLSPGG